VWPGGERTSSQLRRLLKKVSAGCHTPPPAIGKALHEPGADYKLLLGSHKYTYKGRNSACSQNAMTRVGGDACGAELVGGGCLVARNFVDRSWVARAASSTPTATPSNSELVRKPSSTGGCVARASYRLSSRIGYDIRDCYLPSVACGDIAGSGAKWPKASLRIIRSRMPSDTVILLASLLVVSEAASALGCP
jgi:hypothetical protein